MTEVGVLPLWRAAGLPAGVSEEGILNTRLTPSIVSVASASCVVMGFADAMNRVSAGVSSLVPAEMVRLPLHTIPSLTVTMVFLLSTTIDTAVSGVVMPVSGSCSGSAMLVLLKVMVLLSVSRWIYPLIESFTMSLGMVTSNSRVSLVAKTVASASTKSADSAHLPFVGKAMETLRSANVCVKCFSILASSKVALSRILPPIITSSSILSKSTQPFSVSPAK